MTDEGDIADVLRRMQVLRFGHVTPPGRSRLCHEASAATFYPSNSPGSHKPMPRCSHSSHAVIHARRGGRYTSRRLGTHRAVVRPENRDCKSLHNSLEPRVSALKSWAARVLNFREGELPLAVLSAIFYFCVLCGYYFLRPVRDAMGVARGMDDLRWLFVGTSIVALVVVLGFGGVVSRLDRRKFIPIGFWFVIACLFIFAGLLVADALAGRGLIRADTGAAVAIVVGYAFFMWLTVINLFVNSLFWAFMVDLFTVDQGKRMFAFIGVGGTVGAIFGGWTRTVISGLSESVYLSPGLMMIGAGFFAAAIWVMLTLDRMALGSAHSRLAEHVAQHRHSSRPGEKIGGRFLDGVTATAKSPYLVGIALYIFFLAISNTFLYFTHASIELDNTG